MSKKDRVQDFIPIKDIVNGVVRTTDGRYIKILEIEPINFMLRSEEEQCGIIASFAGWLKISPLRLQFKSITKRADSAKYIAALKKELNAEPNESCRELGSDYIHLIGEVGNREALTRRFFLIFSYENAGGIAEDPGRIYGELMAAEQNVRAYLALCGNSVVQPKDEDEAAAEILYTFFNRNLSAEETFFAHVERVVVETMLRQERTIGIDPTPYIPLADFISPKSIDLSRSNCIVMDGTYYTYLYIRGNGYPSRIRGGWLEQDQAQRQTGYEYRLRGACQFGAVRILHKTRACERRRPVLSVRFYHGFGKEHEGTDVAQATDIPDAAFGGCLCF